MSGQNIHPSRFPAMAQERMRLRTAKRRSPDEFSEAQQQALDQITDELITAMAFSIARLSGEVQGLRSTSRRGF